MSIEKAKQKLDEAIYELKLAQIGTGRGPGGRELSLAVTNAEQAAMWIHAAERAKDGASVGGTSESPPSVMAGQT